MFGRLIMLTPWTQKEMVPKFSPLVFDICVGSHMTWEVWCLGGGCMSWMDILNWCIAIKDVWWRGPPWFGDLEIGSLVLITISNSYFVYMFLYYWILACHILMLIMLNLMLIRHVIYIDSPLRYTPVHMNSHLLFSHYSLAIVYILVLKYVHLA